MLFVHFVVSSCFHSVCAIWGSNSGPLRPASLLGYGGLQAGRPVLPFCYQEYSILGVINLLSHIILT